MRIIILSIVVLGLLGGGFLIYLAYQTGAPPRPVAAGPAPEPTAVPAPEELAKPSIDVSRVQDEAARNALEQINKKLARISEYSCVEKTVAKVKNGELAYTEEQHFRRPDRFSARMLQTNHVIPSVVGTITLTVIDGKFKWLESQDKNGRPTLISKYDLGRMEAAGYSAGQAWPNSCQILNPFHSCDMPTLRLESEDSAVWVFSARPTRQLQKWHITEVRLTLSKSDGTLRKGEYYETDPNRYTISVLTDIRINPNLSDSLFQYSPPAGVQVKDQTGDEIRRLSS